MDVDIRDLPFPIRTIEVTPLEGHRISFVLLCGDEGARKAGTFDLRPYLSKGIFKKLNDPQVFNAVHIENDAPTWPGEIDIAPERLYTDCIPE